MVSEPLGDRASLHAPSTAHHDAQFAHHATRSTAHPHANLPYASAAKTTGAGFAERGGDQELIDSPHRWPVSGLTTKCELVRQGATPEQHCRLGAGREYMADPSA
jgi:hypothetical protein